MISPQMAVTVATTGIKNFGRGVSWGLNQAKKMKEKMSQKNSLKAAGQGGSTNPKNAVQLFGNGRIRELIGGWVNAAGTRMSQVPEQTLRDRAAAGDPAAQAIITAAEGPGTSWFATHQNKILIAGGAVAVFALFKDQLSGLFAPAKNTRRRRR